MKQNDMVDNGRYCLSIYHVYGKYENPTKLQYDIVIGYDSGSKDKNTVANHHHA